MTNVVQFKNEAVGEQTQAAVIRARAEVWVTKVMSLKAVDDASLQIIVAEGKTGRQLEDAVKKYFDPFIADAHKIHKKWCDQKKGILDRIGPAIDHLSREVRADKERKDREAAERQRLADIEAAKVKAAAEEALLAQAQALQDAGQKDVAEALISMPVNVPVPVAAPVAQKPEGVSLPVTYKAEIVDMPVFLRSLAEGGLGQDLTLEAFGRIAEAVRPILNGIARKQKELMSIPGVTAVRETGVSFKK